MGRVKVELSGLVKILEKISLFGPRRAIAKLRHENNKKEPHLEIERNLKKVYNVLKELDYEVDIKDILHLKLSFISMEDGIIPGYDMGETISFARAINGERIHGRMWKDKTSDGIKCFRVEVHTEIYPTEINYPETFLEWIKRGSLHLIDPNADYKKGADIFKEEIKHKLIIYYP